MSAASGRDDGATINDSSSPAATNAALSHPVVSSSSSSTSSSLSLTDSHSFVRYELNENDSPIMSNLALHYDPVQDAFIWRYLNDNANQTNTQVHRLTLSELTDVFIGKQHSVFLHSDLSQLNDACCFTLKSESLSLCLHANEQLVSNWLQALNNLIDASNDAAPNDNEALSPAAAHGAVEVQPSTASATVAIAASADTTATTVSGSGGDDIATSGAPSSSSSSSSISILTTGILCSLYFEHDIAPTAPSSSKLPKLSGYRLFVATTPAAAASPSSSSASSPASDEVRLYWAPKTQTNVANIDPKNSFLLQEITDVYLGKQTPPLESAASASASDEQCVAIYTDTTRLHIEAQSIVELGQFVAAIGDALSEKGQLEVANTTATTTIDPQTASTQALASSSLDVSGSASTSTTTASADASGGSREATADASVPSLTSSPSTSSMTSPPPDPQLALRSLLSGIDVTQHFETANGDVAARSIVLRFITGQIDDDLNQPRLVWAPTNPSSSAASPSSSSNEILLRDVTDIYLGRQHAFSKTKLPASVPSQCCITVLTDSDALHIQCASKQDRAFLIAAINAALAFDGATVTSEYPGLPIQNGTEWLQYVRPLQHQTVEQIVKQICMGFQCRLLVPTASSSSSTDVIRSTIFVCHQRNDNNEPVLLWREEPAGPNTVIHRESLLDCSTIVVGKQANLPSGVDESLCVSLFLRSSSSPVLQVECKDASQQRHWLIGFVHFLLDTAQGTRSLTAERVNLEALRVNPDASLNGVRLNFVATATASSSSSSVGVAADVSTKSPTLSSISDDAAAAADVIALNQVLDGMEVEIMTSVPSQGGGAGVEELLRTPALLYFHPQAANGEGAFYWCARDPSSSSSSSPHVRVEDPNRCLPLPFVSDVFLGKHDGLFASALCVELEPRRCLSLVSEETSTRIDVYGTDAEQIQRFLTAFHKLLERGGQEVVLDTPANPVSPSNFRQLAKEDPFTLLPTLRAGFTANVFTAEREGVVLKRRGFIFYRDVYLRDLRRFGYNVDELEEGMGCLCVRNLMDKSSMQPQPQSTDFFLPLCLLTDVFLGKQTPVMKHEVAANCSNNRCVSLQGESRSLELELDSSQQLASFVRVINHLLTSDQIHVQANSGNANNEAGAAAAPPPTMELLRSPSLRPPPASSSLFQHRVNRNHNLVKLLERGAFFTQFENVDAPIISRIFLFYRFDIGPFGTLFFNPASTDDENLVTKANETAAAASASASSISSSSSSSSASSSSSSSTSSDAATAAAAAIASAVSPLSHPHLFERSAYREISIESLTALYTGKIAAIFQQRSAKPSRHNRRFSVTLNKDALSNNDGGAAGVKSLDDAAAATAATSPSPNSMTGLDLSNPHVAAMVGGFPVTLYRGNESRKVDFFYVAQTSSRMGSFFYAEPGVRQQVSTQCLHLREISDVYLGKQSTTLQLKIAEKARKKQCVTLVSKAERWDMEVLEEASLKHIMETIRCVLSLSGRRIIDTATDTVKDREKAAAAAAAAAAVDAANNDDGNKPVDPLVSVSDSHVFSIISTDDMLNLGCDSRQQREAWVEALIWLSEASGKDVLVEDEIVVDLDASSSSVPSDSSSDSTPSSSSPTVSAKEIRKWFTLLGALPMPTITRSPDSADDSSSSSSSSSNDNTTTTTTTPMTSTMRSLESDPVNAAAIQRLESGICCTSFRLVHKLNPALSPPASSPSDLESFPFAEFELRSYPIMLFCREDPIDHFVYLVWCPVADRLTALHSTFSAQAAANGTFPYPSVNLKAITDIYFGRHLPVFVHPAAATVEADRCVSLLSRAHELHVEGESVDAAKQILTGVTALLSHHGKGMTLVEKDALPDDAVATSTANTSAAPTSFNVSTSSSSSSSSSASMFNPISPRVSDGTREFVRSVVGSLPAATNEDDEEEEGGDGVVLSGPPKFGGGGKDDGKVSLLQSSITAEDVARAEKILSGGFHFYRYTRSPTSSSSSVKSDEAEVARSSVSVFYRSSPPTLYWCSVGQPMEPSADRSLPLSELSDIYVGHHSPIFQAPIARHSKEECCLSLVGGHIELHLECDDNDTLKAFLAALGKLLPLQSNGEDTVNNAALTAASASTASTSATATAGSASASSSSSSPIDILREGRSFEMLQWLDSSQRGVRLIPVFVFYRDVEVGVGAVANESNENGGVSGALFWVMKGAPVVPSQSACLPVTSITDIYVGRETPMFNAALDANISQASDEVCFSIIGQALTPSSKTDTDSSSSSSSPTTASLNQHGEPTNELNLEASNEQNLSEFLQGLTELLKQLGKNLTEEPPKDAAAAAASGTESHQSSVGGEGGGGGVGTEHTLSTNGTTGGGLVNTPSRSPAGGEGRRRSIHQIITNGTHSSSMTFTPSSASRHLAEALANTTLSPSAQLITTMTASINDVAIQLASFDKLLSFITPSSAPSSSTIDELVSLQAPVQVVKSMQQHVADERVCERGGTILITLLSSSSPSSSVSLAQVIEHEGLDLLIEVLRRHGRSNITLFLNAVKLFALILNSPSSSKKESEASSSSSSSSSSASDRVDARREIGEKSGCSPLVSSFTTHLPQLSAPQLVQVCTLLRHLCEYPLNRGLLGHFGLIDTLIHAIEHQQQPQQTVTAVETVAGLIDTLNALAQDQAANKSLMAKDASVVVLIKLFSSFPSHPAIHQQAITLLADLTYNAATKTAIINNGGITASLSLLLSAMSPSSSSSSSIAIIQPCLSLLRELSAVESFQSEIDRSQRTIELTSLLLQSLSQMIDDAAVQDATTAVVLNMALASSSARLAATNTNVTTNDTVSSSSSASSSSASSSSSSAFAEYFVSHDGLTLLANAMERWSDVMKIVESCCGALWLLSRVRTPDSSSSSSANTVSSGSSTPPSPMVDSKRMITLCDAALTRFGSQSSALRNFARSAKTAWVAESLRNSNNNKRTKRVGLTAGGPAGEGGDVSVTSSAAL